MKAVERRLCCCTLQVSDESTVAINASMNSYVNIGVMAKFEGLGEEHIAEVKYNVVIGQHIAN